MSVRPATTAELIELALPFVAAKLNRPRDPNCRFGGYLPQRLAIDILHTSNSINADVRSVTAEGIEVFFYSGCEFIRWAEVQSITIRSLDAAGDTTAATVYEHDRLGVIDQGLRSFVRQGIAA